MIPMTKKVLDNLHNFEPHHNVLAVTGVNEFSSNLKFPKTVISTLSNWYNS